MFKAILFDFGGVIYEHPCQVLADFLTIWEMKGKLEGLTLAFIGDGENNVAHSLALGCKLLGINFKCASPIGDWTPIRSFSGSGKQASCPKSFNGKMFK